MSLRGVRVALLIEDEYQILEGWYPLLRLQAAGAEVQVIGSGVKKSYDSKEHYPMDVDLDASEARPEDFDAVIVPGGFAPDNMRLHPPMIDFVRQMFQDGKLTSAICHGGWVLVSAGAVKGKKATGYKPIRRWWKTATGSPRARRWTCRSSVKRSSPTSNARSRAVPAGRSAARRRLPMPPGWPAPATRPAPRPDLRWAGLRGT